MPLVQHKNQSVNVHKFSMVPRGDIPRSRFDSQHAHKTTFDSGKLIPIFVDEMLPGDTFNVSMTGFARMSTPLYPLMDNLRLTTFFFFVPNRLVWTNWPKMMGEQDNPGDSISFTVPTCQSPVGGYAIGSLQDYLGLPTVGQMGGAAQYTHNNLIPRAYNLIWNSWFREENVDNSVVVDKDDGPDTVTDYVLLTRRKRHDYFTSCLPWPQKGATAVSLPLGTSAPITRVSNASNWLGYQGGTNNLLADATVNINGGIGRVGTTVSSAASFDPNGGLIADLSTATAATINALRLAIQTQGILERDARGGTRYVEMIWSHFNVRSPDARLQRPEYLGGGTSPVVINPTVQTSGTSASGTTTPLGQLAGIGTAIAQGGHGCTYSATEHGHIIGLMCIDADLTYQQGVRKMWNRQTRYDFYLPGFANLGEQTVLNREIYADGSANDTAAFGYQARWDELRYFPSMITGLFRSTAAGTLDAWHAAQKFTALPTLNSTFMAVAVPMDRILATAAQTNKQFIFDSFWRKRMSRPLPMYGVPGTIGRF